MQLLLRWKAELFFHPASRRRAWGFGGGRVENLTAMLDAGNKDWSTLLPPSTSCPPWLQRVGPGGDDSLHPTQFSTSVPWKPRRLFLHFQGLAPRCFGCTLAAKAICRALSQRGGAAGPAEPVAICISPHVFSCPFFHHAIFIQSFITPALPVGGGY